MRANDTGVPQDYTEAGVVSPRPPNGTPLGSSCTIQSSTPECCTATTPKSRRTNPKEARLVTLACDKGSQPTRINFGIFTAPYPADTRVRIAGLTAAAHLNDRLGTAVTPTRPLAAGRIAVRIDGQTKSVSLSWANVMRQVGSASR